LFARRKLPSMARRFTIDQTFLEREKDKLMWFAP
jgi:hypothetical protein